MANAERTADWLAGYAVAAASAAAIARLYESELRRMAVDSWMLSPTRNGDYSPAAVAKEIDMGEEGWRKGEAAQAAENIAAAIEGMRP